MKRILPLLIAIVLLGAGCDNNQQITIQNQQKKIDDLNKSVENLAKQNAEIQKQQKSISAQPLKTQPKTIIKEVPQATNVDVPPKNIDLSSIIKQWQSKVVHIECKWKGEDGSYIFDAFGSGLFSGKNNVYMVFTNKHVVSYGGQAPWTCQMIFPYIEETYTVNIDTQTMTMKDLAFDPNFDVGELFIRNPSSKLQSMSTVNYCNKTADIGDQIVVLGYPGIGSLSGITATEGIISGYDNGYYITSAKVEHGNSGGVAVLVKDNCYLGIPSYVSAGKLESLARILDFNFWHNYYSR